ncbi:hypothetical protein MNBD_NITROSPINAE02-2196 [hydrothermal vent metagenome]|uniref:Uncharacterized protein n=1 Tax=hydrothermal vent metagenome TaxID=652676 RepID=A0A3B1C6M0_9ZZZZ
MDEKKNSKELKALSHAITEALLQNEEVMNLLADFKDRKIVDPNTLMGVAFKISDLLEIYDVTVSETDGEMASVQQTRKRKRKETDIQKITKLREIIDGRDLSKNEIAFQEWLIERFDDKNWLKGERLIW